VKLLLIRHGLTDWTGKRLPGRTLGIHLNEVGRAQVHALAQRLASLPLGAIYASPLERALETAGPLAAAHGLDFRVNDGLGDVDCGEWAGRDLEDLRQEALWQVIQAPPSAARFPGGESLREARDRIVAALDGIRDAHQGQVVAVVSHADPIKLAVAHFVGVPLDLYHRLLVSPASVTALDLDSLGMRLICLNRIEDPLPILLAERHTPIPSGPVANGCTDADVEPRSTACASRDL
jgi:probable phosphoglycerate mutase